MHPTARLAALLAMLLLLPGCVMPAADSDEAFGLLRDARGWATLDMRLDEAAAPADGAVAAGGFFSAWAEGDDYPTWHAEAAPRDLLVTDVRLHLVLRATGPVLETHRFPDVMVYAGGGGSWIGYGSTQTPSVLVPGETLTFDVDVEGPAGGLWVPAGERFGIKVVPVMFQEDAADIEILVGPAGTYAEWSQAPLASAPRPTAKEQGAGELAGSAYAGAAAPESTSARFPITIPQDAQALVAWMNVTAHDGIPDVDLSLERPDGTPVAFSGTPTPREHLKLAAPAIEGGGDHVLVVTSYGSAQASFTLEWALG